MILFVVVELLILCLRLRINLLVSLLQSNMSESPPGAELNILDLVNSKTILGAFPLHDFEELKTLQIKWLDFFSPPWKQPIGMYILQTGVDVDTDKVVFSDDIKNYFGERIGFYFYFLQHYVESMFFPAITGLISYIGK
jgi:hypothetical protein